MSFQIDPPLLVGSGAAIGRYVEDERLAPRLPLADGPRVHADLGLRPVDERKMTTARHALALSQFALYPAWLALGARIGRASRGG